MYSGQLPAGWWLSSQITADDAMWTRKSVGNILDDAANSGQGPNILLGTTWDQSNSSFYEGFRIMVLDEWIALL